MQWIRQVDQLLLLWCNRRLSRPFLDWLLGWMTHLGGATFTIVSAVLLAGFAKEELGRAGQQSLMALAVSHVIAVLIKKTVRRVRPFRKLDNIKVGKFPLKDYSFPSGHTTAIFALVTPLTLVVTPAIAIMLSGVALLVAFSRIYWGYHYPLDCVAGGMIGGITAMIIAL